MLINMVISERYKMSLRELMVEYILFACDSESLMNEFQITVDELIDLGDVDLLEIYDRTLLAEITGE